MARAIRRSASSALMVHSEKDLASRKLDECLIAASSTGALFSASPIMVASKRIPVSGSGFLFQAYFALQQGIFSTPRNENTPNVLNGRKHHARELSGVYSGCSIAHFHAIHGSDLPRLSQADGVQGQKAHPIQQRTDGSDLSLRHLRCRDQEDSQRALSDPK